MPPFGFGIANLVAEIRRLIIHRRVDLVRCCAAGVRGAAVEGSNLRFRNERLKRKIDGAMKTRPELEAVMNYIALKQPKDASLEQVQANLQEVARAIIAAKPELDGYFDA